MSIALDEDVLADGSVLLARQPIFNKSQDVQAYSLLYRSDKGTMPLDFSDEQATASVILNNYAVASSGGKTKRLPLFVKLTQSMLLSDMLFAVMSVLVVLYFVLSFCTAFILYVISFGRCVFYFCMSVPSLIMYVVTPFFIYATSFVIDIYICIYIYVYIYISLCVSFVISFCLTFVLYCRPFFISDVLYVFLYVSDIFFIC